MRIALVFSLISSFAFGFGPTTGQVEVIGCVSKRATCVEACDKLRNFFLKVNCLTKCDFDSAVCLITVRARYASTDPNYNPDSEPDLELFCRDAQSYQ